jgi:hypothetical protein
VRDREAAFARFPRRVRDRLEGFGEAIDTVPNDNLALFATRSLDRERHDEARAAADRIASEHGWDRGIAALRDVAIDWVGQRMDDPTAWLGAVGTRADSLSMRPEDLGRVGQSLADAFRAVALWDDLDDERRDELLGPWASLVEAA